MSTRSWFDDAEKVFELLDRIDTGSIEAAPGIRRAKRFTYRIRYMKLRLSNQGSWREVQCVTRNISATGISIVVNVFVYPGTRCTVELVTLQNQQVVHEGEVVRCRYIEGSPRLHEIGIRFARPVNASMFHPGAVPTRLLMVDDDATIHKIAEVLLKGENIIITSAMDGPSAIEAIKTNVFDLAFVDYVMPGMNGLDLVRQLRAQGITMPMVLLTGLSEAETREACLSAGFDAWGSKPFTKDSLRSIIQRFKPEPIISSLIDQPEMAGVVEMFISQIQSRIQKIESALASSDLKSLADEIREIRVHSGTCGFEPIRDAAINIEKRVAEGISLTEIQGDIVKIARLCRAAVGQSLAEDGDSVASGEQTPKPQPVKAG